MKAWITSAAVVLCLGLASTTFAQCQGAKAEGVQGQQASHVMKVSDEKGGCAAKAGKEGCESACHGNKALAAMPKMECHVADEVVNCPLKAAEIAKAHDNAKITYVVDKEEYTDRSEALNAYAKVLDNYLGAMTSVRFAVGDKCVTCPMAAQALAKQSGAKVQYQVALVGYTSKDDADQAAKLAHEAADKVAMKVLVDGKEVACGAGASCCAKSGAAAGATCSKSKGEASAAKSDAKVETVAAEDKGEHKSCHADGQTTASGKREFVVGEMKTCCSDMAKVQLAVAKIMAAHQASQQYAANKSDEKLASGAQHDDSQAAN